MMVTMLQLGNTGEFLVRGYSTAPSPHHFKLVSFPLLLPPIFLSSRSSGLSSSACSFCFAIGMLPVQWYLLRLGWAAVGAHPDVVFLC